MELELNTGWKIPVVGYGTWLSFDEQLLTNALNEALKCGYRHIDTASAYNNEQIIGKVLKEWLDSEKITRSDVFITTKLPPWGLKPEKVERYLQRSMKLLQLDYIDMFLIHLPITLNEYHDANGPCAGFKNDGTVDMDKSTDHIAVWKVMESLQEKGLTRGIGLSNFNSSQMQKILDNCKIRPANAQFEYHIYLQQDELVQFCKNQGMVVTAYASLGSKGFSMYKSVPGILDNKIVAGIAEKHKKTPAQVLLKHSVQKGLVVIPKSTSPERVRENIAIFDFELDDEDMESLNGLDCGYRIYDFETMFQNIRTHPEYPF